jgi:hypothetical protein
VGIAAGEVAACGTDIWHEKRVAHEDRIANLVGRVRGGVARHIQRFCRQATDGKLLVFAEKMVELGPVYMKLGLEIKKLLEDPLNGANVLSNCNPAAKLAAQIMRC